MPKFGEQMHLVQQELTPSIEATFEDFWTLYPRHVAKKDATKAWEKLTPEYRLDAVLALVNWRKLWVKRGEMEFVPYAATWLNGERWTDELPKDIAQRPSCQTAFKVREDEPRGEMPQAVRELIAKLKK